MWFFFLFFKRKVERVKETKQHQKHSVKASVDALSLVEFVSLWLLPLVSVLAGAYQRVPFINARIKPPLWLFGTLGGGLGLGGRKTKIAWQRKSQLKMEKKGRSTCAFRRKWKKKTAAVVMGIVNVVIDVSTCVIAVFFVLRGERRKRATFFLYLGKSYFIKVNVPRKINMYLP